jgi:hypothetical protein
LTLAAQKTFRLSTPGFFDSITKRFTTLSAFSFVRVAFAVTLDFQALTIIEQ